MNVICTHRWLLLGAAAGLAMACWGLDNLALPAEPDAARGKAAEAAHLPAPTQASGAAAAKPDALGNNEQVVSIGRALLKKTNWLGWMFYAAEGSLSIMAMTVALERLVNLRRRKLIPRRFVRRLRDLVARREDSVENLRALCDSSETPVGNVLMAGVLRAGRPLPEVEKAMEDSALREAGTQRSRNRTLSVIATVAPMVGLLGTVIGMILAFRAVSQQGTGSNAPLLAQGIYLALLRTAFGLLIAVPSLLCAHWFNTRVDRYLREMIDVLQETIPAFADMEKSAEVNGEPLRASQPPGRTRTR